MTITLLHEMTLIETIFQFQDCFYLVSLIKYHNMNFRLFQKCTLLTEKLKDD